MWTRSARHDRQPAAAGEGISLHHAAHDAIYLDRSYVSTHYLQSIDRIHRLGLNEGVETHIWIIKPCPCRPWLHRPLR